MLISALTVQFKSKLRLIVRPVYKFHAIRLEDSLKPEALEGFTAFDALITKGANLDHECCSRLPAVAT